MSLWCVVTLTPGVGVGVAVGVGVGAGVGVGLGVGVGVAADLEAAGMAAELGPAFAGRDRSCGAASDAPQTAVKKNVTDSVLKNADP
jgi:hypothetical protein